MKITVGPITYNTENRDFRWTQQAKECYRLGCQCDKCEITNLISSRCNMKYCVKALVHIYGPPPLKIEHHRKTIVNKLVSKIGEME